MRRIHSGADHPYPASFFMEVMSKNGLTDIGAHIPSNHSSSIPISGKLPLCSPATFNKIAVLSSVIHKVCGWATIFLYVNGRPLTALIP